MTGLMLKTALQALQLFFPLEPDWMAKAAAMKLPHRGRASSAAFDRQAAHPNRFHCRCFSTKTERENVTTES